MRQAAAVNSSSVEAVTLMRRRNLHPLYAALLAAMPAFAQTAEEPFVSKGQATVGGIVTDTSGKDLSKFMEYQDLRNGVLSNIGIVGRDSKRWIDAYGENFGRDDMYVSVRGVQYDRYKYRIYSNWMPHNLLFNGLTPFHGAGTANLSATFPQPNPATAAAGPGFQRKDTGGSFEWQAYSPWYFRVDGNQVKQSGEGRRRLERHEPWQRLHGSSAAGPVRDQQRHGRDRLRHGR
jgi:hypothetical protein